MQDAIQYFLAQRKVQSLILSMIQRELNDGVAKTPDLQDALLSQEASAKDWISHYDELLYRNKELIPEDQIPEQIS